MADRGAVVVDPTDDEETNVRIKRSVCHSYTVLLLLLIVRESSDVDYLQRFGANLLAFTAQGAYVTAAPPHSLSILLHVTVHVSELRVLVDSLFHDQIRAAGDFHWQMCAKIQR